MCCFCKKTKHITEYQQQNKTCNECLEKKKQWREKQSEKRYFCHLCEYDVQLYKKNQHEKGKFHQENVRKQTHPEEFENEDQPDRIDIDKYGRKFFICNACRCPQMFPYQWRPHIRTEAHIHNKAGKLHFRFG